MTPSDLSYILKVSPLAILAVLILWLVVVYGVTV